MDPMGVAARDLRECLMAQLKDLMRVHDERGGEPDMPELLEDAMVIADKHLHMLQNKQIREIGRAMSKSMERVERCVALIRTLDPKPGLRYNVPETRLIEPDVAIIKQGDEYLVVMNDDDMPQLRLNPTYKKLLSREGNEKDVRTYVKERYKSAIQLIKNIEQRKQTILKVCYAIIGRQDGVSGFWHRLPEADDDQGSGGGDRRASFDGEPRRGQQVRAHPAGGIRAALFLQRERERARGRRDLAADPEAPGKEADRGRRSLAAAHR